MDVSISSLANFKSISMQAQFQTDGTIAVSGTTRIETFDRIWAGIGWPDKEPGCICAVGRRLDGRLHALWEKRGGLWEMGEAALEAKNRFLVERVMVDAGDELATSYLRTLDGLCFSEMDEQYESNDTTYSRLSVDYRTPPGALTTVVPVPDRITGHYRSALEKTRGVIIAGRLLVHEANCPKLVYTLRQPLDELIRSPVMKALVWVVAVLDEYGEADSATDAVSLPWYANVPRERA